MRAALRQNLERLRIGPGTPVDEAVPVEAELADLLEGLGDLLVVEDLRDLEIGPVDTRQGGCIRVVVAIAVGSFCVFLGTINILAEFFRPTSTERAEVVVAGEEMLVFAVAHEVTGRDSIGGADRVAVCGEVDPTLRERVVIAFDLGGELDDFGELISFDFTIVRHDAQRRPRESHAQERVTHLGIRVDVLLALALLDAIQRRLRDVQVACLDQLTHLPEEERE